MTSIVFSRTRVTGTSASIGPLSVTAHWLLSLKRASAKVSGVGALGPVHYRQHRVDQISEIKPWSMVCGGPRVTDSSKRRAGWYRVGRAS